MSLSYTSTRVFSKALQTSITGTLESPKRTSSGLSPTCDTLLRQAIGNTNYRVYHMQTATTSEGNQATKVMLDDDVERALVDLVGDLAAYRPHAKVVVLEGTSQDGFDEKLIRRLFPDFAKKVNLVSAESKEEGQGPLQRP